MNITINGLSVNTFGNPEKQSIIFIHGFPLDHSMWKNQINALEENFYCVAYDVRGLGKSTVDSGQYMLEFFVEDLLAIIDELKLVKPFLCGLSMGGYIALRAVEKKQELFNGLILCDTKPEADSDANKLTRAANIKMIEIEGNEKFSEMFVTNCFAEETPAAQPQMFNNFLDIAKKSNPVGVKGCIIAIMSRTDTTSFLHKIILPTLVICGAYDKLTPPPLMRSMAEKITGSEFASIPAAGHMAPLENPSCVNDLIGGFLNRNL